MKRQPIHDLIDELDRLFYGRSSGQSLIGTSSVPRGDDFAASPAPRARRRKRKSSLDEYKSVAEAFVIRRARSARPACFTYSRLQNLIARKSGRLYSVSAIHRRMERWGLGDGMRRYEK